MKTNQEIRDELRTMSIEVLLIAFQSVSRPRWFERTEEEAEIYGLVWDEIVRRIEGGLSNDRDFLVIRRPRWSNGPFVEIPDIETGVACLREHPEFAAVNGATNVPVFRTLELVVEAMKKEQS